MQTLRNIRDIRDRVTYRRQSDRVTSKTESSRKSEWHTQKDIRDRVQVTVTSDIKQRQRDKVTSKTETMR